MSQVKITSSWQIWDVGILFFRLKLKGELLLFENSNHNCLPTKFFVFSHFYNSLSSGVHTLNGKFYILEAFSLHLSFITHLFLFILMVLFTSHFLNHCRIDQNGLKLEFPSQE